MPAWSRLIPNSSDDANIPSLSMPWIVFVKPRGTKIVTMPVRQFAAPHTTVFEP